MVVCKTLLLECASKKVRAQYKNSIMKTGPKDPVQQRITNFYKDN